MKRHEPIQIGKLIRQSIEDAGSADKYDAQRICFLWPEVVGPTINRFTTARWIARDELHVTIASGPVKSELSFMADKIMERLNQRAGMSDKPLIRKLIIH